MAVILPADLPPDDARPIFDKVHLPGGPWRTYRARQTVDAVRVRGDFLVRRADGALVERSDSWLTIDLVTGDPKILTPSEFANSYEIL